MDVNDLVVYYDSDSYIVHRLIQKNGNNMVAKGDANNSTDKPITQEQILGKVVSILPQIGLIKKVLISPEIIRITIIFIIFIILSKIIFTKIKKGENNSNKDG